MLRFIPYVLMFVASCFAVAEESYPQPYPDDKEFDASIPIIDEKNIQYLVKKIGTDYQKIFCKENEGECSKRKNLYSGVSTDEYKSILQTSLKDKWEVYAYDKCSFKNSSISTVDVISKNSTVYDKEKNHIKEKRECYVHLQEGFVYLKGAVDKWSGEISFSEPDLDENIEILDDEIEKLDGIQAQLGVGAESSKASKILNDVDGNLVTDQIWFAQFYVGEKISPRYDEDGRNTGFDLHEFYAVFNLDTRWEFDFDKSHEKIKKFIHGYALLPGVNIKFYSADVVNCALLDEDQKAACYDGINSDSSVQDLKFNDIADTVDASMHMWVPFYLTDTKSVDVALGGKLGVQSRDRLDEDGNSVESYTALGLRFDYNDFFISGNKKIKNGVPRFSLAYTYNWMHDYANIGKSRRHIVYGDYRIFDELPIYLGLGVNKGKGPDAVALTISYGFKMENLLPKF